MINTIICFMPTIEYQIIFVGIRNKRYLCFTVFTYYKHK